MITKRTVLKSALLDANIIIEAYALGIWENLLDTIDVIVPSVVAHDEAMFFSNKNREIPRAINLPRLIELGKIKEVAATIEEIHTVRALFDRVFIQELHDGG